LTELVELKVDFNLKDEISYVYERYSPFYHMKKSNLAERARGVDLEQDTLALEEFRVVVKSQGMGCGSGFQP
jgi:hypothetical protein